MSEAHSIAEALSLSPKFFSATTFTQLGYGLWINMLTFCIGISFSIPIMTIPLAQVNYGPNSNNPFLNENNWTVTMLLVGSPIGSIVNGLVIDRFGRKIGLVIGAIPLFVGWTVVGLAGSSETVMIGHIISGSGIGMTMTAIYVLSAEFSSANIRSVIGSFPHIILSIGIVFQGLVSLSINWSITFVVIAVAALIIAPLSSLVVIESPYFYCIEGKEFEMGESLRKYRHKKRDIDPEKDEIMEFYIDNDIRRLNFREKVGLLLSLACFKPFVTILGIMSICQLSGISVLLFCSSSILKISLAGGDLKNSLFLISISRVLGGLLCGVGLYTFGKKKMAIISGLGFGISLSVLGGLLLTEHSKFRTWLLVMLCFSTIFASLSFYTLPMLLASEVYPLQVRGFLVGATDVFQNVFVCCTVISFPHLCDWIGLDYTLICYGIVSLLGCVFFYFCLPETHDLTLLDIEEYYNKRRGTLVSQRRIFILQKQRSSQKSLTNRSLERTKSKTADRLKSKYARRVSSLRLREAFNSFSLSNTDKNIGDARSSKRVKVVKIKTPKSQSRNSKISVNYNFPGTSDCEKLSDQTV